MLNLASMPRCQTTISKYHITKNGTSIDLNITQPGAVISKTSITAGVYNGMVSFTQVEEKVRSNSTVVSTMNFVSSLEDIRNPNITTAPARGYYHAYFAGTVSSIFGYVNGTQGATHILGNIDKTTVSDPLFPAQWASFRREFPEFFDNSTGHVSPNWTQILGDAGLPL
ncbi:hypothetical protein DOTSEDRAFT_45580 [Dothistroma septosporum NZE10]|uniref:Uncharacterized protein n=1 Tax=Dothistroma septosporum (strain NZE10 / CBS 128990) TaxID=675120 RepID=N1PL17_DOTSN|nr:hypothetical protein DOTSEDRAFT_45580 [Dothistroma septosporum NZE10]